MLKDSGLRGVHEGGFKAGTVTAMSVRGMTSGGHIVKRVKRGKPISFSLTFHNIGEEMLNVYAVFKCYRKKGGTLVWEFATTPQKVASNKTVEFVATINTGILLPVEYFAESTGRFNMKHAEHTTKVFRKDFMVIR